MSHSKTSFTLSQFKEKILPAGFLEPLNISAYRMDVAPEKNNIKNMAHYADLGTLFCCDYLYISNGKAVLIEDTRLFRQWEEMKKELSNIEEKENKANKVMEKQNTVNKCDNTTIGEQKQRNLKIWELMKKNLVKENCLKVYGALLILCRLSERYTELADILDQTSLNFWFVINDDKNITDDIKATEEGLNFVKNQLKKSLSGALQGAKLVKTVKILFVSKLEKNLQSL